MLLHHEQAAVGARDGPFHHQQVTLGVSLNYLQSFDCHTLIAHVTGHARSLQDSARRGAGTNRTGRARAVRLTVCLRATTEAMTFDSALEPLSFGGTDDINFLADGKQVCAKLFAQFQTFGVRALL